MKTKIKAEYNMKRLRNLTPLNFEQKAKPKVKTGRGNQISKEEKFKVLLRKQIEQLQQSKLKTSQFT